MQLWCKRRPPASPDPKRPAIHRRSTDAPAPPPRAPLVRTGGKTRVRRTSRKRGANAAAGRGWFENPRWDPRRRGPDARSLLLRPRNPSPPYRKSLTVPRIKPTPPSRRHVICTLPKLIPYYIKKKTYYHLIYKGTPPTIYMFSGSDTPRESGYSHQFSQFEPDLKSHQNVHPPINCPKMSNYHELYIISTPHES